MDHEHVTPAMDTLSISQKAITISSGLLIHAVDETGDVKVVLGVLARAERVFR